MGLKIFSSVKHLKQYGILQLFF